VVFGQAPKSPICLVSQVPKTVWRLRQAKVKCLALQFPEGLLLYATTLSDIFQTFAGVEDVVILGKVRPTVSQVALECIYRDA
jgi:hypothetical protein